MNLNSTFITLPDHIHSGRYAWSGTLIDLIRYDEERLERRAFDCGLPLGEDDYPAWELFTPDDWRKATGDPCAVIVSAYGDIVK